MRKHDDAVLLLAAFGPFEEQHTDRSPSAASSGPPAHIVNKLVETVQRGDTHGYSVSKGIPRLRRAICHWYERRWGVSKVRVWRLWWAYLLNLARNIV